MVIQTHLAPSLAASITRAASLQTYYTIRFLADRDRVEDAYRAYAYFRWVDDVLDEPPIAGQEGAAHSHQQVFLARQQDLLEAATRGETPAEMCAEEELLFDLVRSDRGEHPGLQSYLRNMMAVMAFDVRRRGCPVSTAELEEYTRCLSAAVTDALLYFIDPHHPAQAREAHCLAVSAAHIAHMLRDTYEDLDAGYYNIPQEVLQAHGITPHDVDSPAYRLWVRRRVILARLRFKTGRRALARTSSLRLRLAGCAYTARFEWMLHAIEGDGYRLRRAYPQRKRLPALLWTGWTCLKALFASQWGQAAAQRAPLLPARSSRP